MAQVPAVRVPLDLDAIGVALGDAWEGVTGEPLDPDVLPWLLALVKFEGGSSLWNYNLGNITTHGDPDDWTQIGNNPRKFVAYESLDDAARGFVEFITKPHKRPIVEAAAAGNFPAFWQHYTDRWVVSPLSAEHQKNFSRVLRSLGWSAPIAAPPRGARGCSASF